MSLVFGGAELLRLAHYSIEHLQQAPLFVDQQFRIANNVDEENVRDLQLDLFFDLSGLEMREGGNVLSVCESFSFLETSGKSKTRTSTNGETDKRSAGWNPLASCWQAV